MVKKELGYLLLIFIIIFTFALGNMTISEAASVNAYYDVINRGVRISKIVQNNKKYLIIYLKDYSKVSGYRVEKLVNNKYVSKTSEVTFKDMKIYIPTKLIGNINESSTFRIILKDGSKSKLTSVYTIKVKNTADGFKINRSPQIIGDVKKAGYKNKADLGTHLTFRDGNNIRSLIVYDRYNHNKIVIHKEYNQHIKERETYVSHESLNSLKTKTTHHKITIKVTDVTGLTTFETMTLRTAYGKDYDIYETCGTEIVDSWDTDEEIVNSWDADDVLVDNWVIDEEIIDSWD